MHSEYTGRMDGRIELRRRIQAELERRDWSMRQASLAAKLSPATLPSFLNGSRKGLGTEACRAVAKLFGWPEDEVLELAGHKTPTPSVADPLAQIEALVRRGPWTPEVAQALSTLLYALSKADAQRQPLQWEPAFTRAAARALEPIGAGGELRDEDWLTIILHDLKRFFAEELAKDAAGQSRP